jgi:rfaE bifunctional protein nucleotidyltransferase chain/domain
MIKSKNKIVLAGGCFDILHFGHIHFLKKAKSFGNYLIVALESDKNIKRLKGEGRPFNNQKQRKEILESLRFVDEVTVLKDHMTDKDYMDLVTKIKPSIIAITKGDLIKKLKQKQAERVGAKIIEIKKIPFLSSSLLSKIIPKF